MTPPRAFRSGVNWMPDRQKLYRFDRDGVTVIRPWPHPQAWRKDAGRTWRGHAADVQLGVADGESRTWPHRFEREAWSTVPEGVRRLVLRCAMSGRQWSALNLAARAPAARPMMRDFPLLAATLADVNWLRSLQGRARLAQPWRAARAHGGRATSWRGWQGLAGWLGLPTDKAFLRLMRRVERPRDGLWSVAAVHELSVAWRHPKARKLLLHLPGPTILQATLLAEASADDAVMHSLRYRLLADATRPIVQANVVETVLSLLDLRTRVLHPPPLGPLETLEQVERARESLVAHIPSFIDHPWAPLPPPPLPGTDRIRPLTSPSALDCEGREMNHCIGGMSWARLARNHEGYAYSVRIPGATGDADPLHRATVWIAPDRSARGTFRVEQIQGPGNTAPSLPVVEEVQDWLNLAALRLAVEGVGPTPEWFRRAPPVHDEDEIPF